MRWQHQFAHLARVGQHDPQLLGALKSRVVEAATKRTRRCQTIHQSVPSHAARPQPRVVDLALVGEVALRQGEGKRQQHESTPRTCPSHKFGTRRRIRAALCPRNKLRTCFEEDSSTRSGPESDLLDMCQDRRAAVQGLEQRASHSISVPTPRSTRSPSEPAPGSDKPATDLAVGGWDN
eukprot:scaffold201055_cov29-Tisochrysis_lutea.AAC.9